MKKKLLLILAGLITGHLLSYLPYEWMITIAIILVAVGSFMSGMLFQMGRDQRAVEEIIRRTKS